MKKHHYLLIFVFAALVISLIFNFRVLAHIVDILEKKPIADFSKRQMSHFLFLIFNMTSSFFMFLFFGLMNFYVLSKVNQLVRNKYITAFTIVLVNLLLFFVLIHLQKNISHECFIRPGRFSRRMFMFSNYVLAIFGLVLAYYLLLIKKMNYSKYENIRLKEENSKAELSALKDQISPHFFFNSMSSLSSIVRNEHKSDALEFIQDLSSIYRYTLSCGGVNLVSVQDEMNFIEAYVALLKKRFGDKLSLIVNLPSLSAKDKVPPMSLQLLLENAIKHNVVTQKKPLLIEIFIEGNCICVKNNLQEKKYTNSFGIGLQNLSFRYKLIADEDIVVLKTEDSFIVKLPLL